MIRRKNQKVIIEANRKILIKIFKFTKFLPIAFYKKFK